MRTTASVGGHPVHMMVVHFPMAFLMGSAAFGTIQNPMHLDEHASELMKPKALGIMCRR